VRFSFRVTPTFAYLTEGSARVVDKYTCIVDPKRDDLANQLCIGFDGLIHFFNREEKTLPSGLIYRITRRLEKRGHEVELVYDPPLPHIDPVPVDYLVGINMRDYQVDAVNRGLSDGRGIWQIATNGGKSACIAAFSGSLARNGMKTLVIVPNINLVHQTSRDITGLLGPDVKVTIAGDGHIDTSGDILVGTFQTLARGCQYGDDPAENPEIHKYMVNANAVIVDEAHRASSPSIQAILRQCYRAVFRIGCTGTVDKSDKTLRKGSDERAREHRWRMEQQLGPLLVQVKNAQLIEAGFSAKPTIVVIDDRRCFGPHVDSPRPIPGRPFNATAAYRQVFTEAAIEDKVFRKSVIKVIAAFLAAGKAPFVFSHSVEQVRRLAKTAEHFGVPCETLIGPDRMPRRLSVVGRFARDQNFAVLCSSIFDEGFSLPQITGIILAGSRKAPFELLQRIGRGLRRKAEDNTITVVDFAMPHSPMLNNHFLVRLASFRDQQFDVRRISDFSNLSTLKL
jgi:superfamily II DNA or RNA helicase